MTGYVDSSVLLRLVLGQPASLAEWSDLQRGVASELVEVECLRTLDRLRHEDAISSADAVTARRGVYRILDTLEVVGLSRAVLGRAGQPLPSPLGTLDAIHLVTAMLWSETFDEGLVMLTHDAALAAAARASGLEALGA